jgi:hypothetical protein
MKITRRQIRKLIRETVYKFGKPPRTLDHEIERFEQERERSNTRIDSNLSPRARDHLAVFDEDDPDYAEEFRLALDPDRPTVPRLKQTFDTIVCSSPGFGYGRTQSVFTIEIPFELVDDLIDKHLLVQANPSAADKFRQAYARVCDHIDNKIDEFEERYDQGFTVEDYSYDPQGYRAREYHEAMLAYGEYP